MQKINYKSRRKYLLRGSLLILVGVGALIFIIYSNFNNKSNNNNNKITDAVKFKKEYEVLNNEKTANDENKYLPISINKDNPVKYLSEKDLEEFLTEGTGIIYFGFPECPWCRNLIPVLLDALNEKDINDVYYMNVKELRDIKILSNGEIITQKEATNSYKIILEKLSNYLPAYEGLNDESIRRLYVPAIFFVKNGEVVGTHFNTVDSQTNPMVPLTEIQYNELKKLLLKNIEKVYNLICTSGC